MKTEKPLSTDRGVIEWEELNGKELRLYVVNDGDTTMLFGYSGLENESYLLNVMEG